MDDRIKQMSPRPLGAGSQIDWYSIREVLGMGGLGITYRAQDGKLDREVAIREYLPTSYAVRHGKYSVEPISGDHEKRYAQGLTNFLTVANLLEQFHHDNIIQVHNVVETNNTAYMVMECENGISLDSIIEQCGTLEQNHQTQILFPIFKGLQKIHELGFVHLSIKPSNIRIRESGSPVLLDFGSARQTSLHRPIESTALVNQGYMPLEQYSDGYGEQGPWTDIYSLAAIMYEGVRGIKPDEALSRSDYLLRGQPDTVQELLAEANPTYTQVFLSALHAGLTVLPLHRPQSLSHWQCLFEGDLRAYRHQLEDGPSTSIDDTSTTTSPEFNTPDTSVNPSNDTMTQPVDNFPAAGSNPDNSAINAPVNTPMGAAAYESYEEFDNALNSTAPDEMADEMEDEMEDEYRNAGILATKSKNSENGVKSILLGCLIVAFIAVAVGILYVQTNGAHLRPGTGAGDSAASESNKQHAATKATEQNITLLEQSADTKNDVLSDTASNTNSGGAITDSNSESMPTQTSNLEQPVGNLTAASAPVYFDKPLPNDPQSDNPRTFSQIVESTSPFSPIEGMDDKFWKGKDCSECHNWTRENLCQQGKYYSSGDDSKTTRIQHPFDGYFKQALKNWAGSDCG